LISNVAGDDSEGRRRRYASALAGFSVQERKHWRLIGNGEGIHWPDLDEDISVEGLLSGRASGESQRSFKAWLEARRGPRIQPTRKKHARG
jgi:hypothetical protein